MPIRTSAEDVPLAVDFSVAVVIICQAAITGSF